MSPRVSRVAALPKPTGRERTQMEALADGPRVLRPLVRVFAGS
ncbi:MAG: hypothetical protein ACLPY3_11425 [Solirubrobacteraceae bacterium]